MKEQALELAPREPQSLAVNRSGISLEAAYNAVVGGNLDAEKLAVMKDLLGMDAERKFNAAFSALQADLPTIVASTPIPNRGKYERFEDVMRQVQPVLTKHGFAVSFTNSSDEHRVTETCILRHAGGHQQQTSFSVRTSRADSETQSDVKASTTAKRKALQNALNIVIRQDCLDEEHDARLEGGPVSTAQALELERRVKALNKSVQAFLKHAGATSFAEIPASRYHDLNQTLSGMEGVK